MVKKNLEIINELGIHVRPATLIVKEANKYKSSIRISKDDTEIDGKSILEILMLAAEKGSQIIITVDGPDECDMLNAIEKLFTDKFGEN